jgi:hypothetical protein
LDYRIAWPSQVSDDLHAQLTLRLHSAVCGFVLETTTTSSGAARKEAPPSTGANQRRRWNATAHPSGVGMDAESVIAGFVAATPGAVASANAALPARFPNQVADAILDGASRSAAKLAAMSLG